MVLMLSVRVRDISNSIYKAPSGIHAIKKENTNENVQVENMERERKKSIHCQLKLAK